MKKNIITMLLVLYAWNLKAQEYDYVDSLESVQINIKAGFDSTYGSINTSYLPVNNILIDKTLWLVQPESFNGTTNSDTLNLMKFYQVYSSIRNSHYSIPNWIYHTDTLKSKVISYDSTLVPISIIFFEYSKIKQNAFDDSLLTVSNDIIYDVQGRQESPYEPDNLLAASSLRTVFSELNVSFVIDSTMYLFSNLSSQIDSVLIDLGDGYGQKYVNVGDTLIAYYPDNGSYFLKFSVFCNGTEYKSYSTILIHSASILYTRSTNLLPDIEFNLTSDIAYQGVYASGKVSVYLGCGNTGIKKPFIVLPGFDPFDDENRDSTIKILDGKNRTFFECQPIFVDYLLNEAGYDLIILDYHNGSDYIQRNAFLAETLINWVNNELEQNESEKNITLFGISMGGLVGRYALLDMENKNIDHNVQLYISGDTPHQGANIPYAYQKLAISLKKTAKSLVDEVSSQLFGLLGGFIGEFIGGIFVGILADNLVYNEIDDLLNKSFYSPAAKQMLDGYLDVYNQTHFNAHGLRTQLLNEMSQMGNYPSKSRLVAISNGSLNNDKQINLQPGDKMVGWHHDTYMLNMILNIHTNLHNSTNHQQVLKLFVEYRKIRWWCLFCSLFMMEKVVDLKASIKNAPAVDCTPGGYININHQVANGINSLGKFHPANYYGKPNISFIPTYSSLDITKNDPQIDLINGTLSIIDGLANYSLSTPFEEVYFYESSYYNENQNHTDFCSVSLYDVINNEISGGIIDAKDRVILNSQDILYEGRQKIKLGNSAPLSTDMFLIENGGSLRAYAGQEVIINKDFIAEEGCNFHAKIIEFPNCSSYQYKSKIGQNIDDDSNNSAFNSSHNHIQINILPNPFTEDTRISISLSSSDIITLTVYDVLGNRIAVLADMTEFSTGTHNFNFSGHNINSGVYYVVMSSSTERISHPLMLIK